MQKLRQPLSINQPRPSATRGRKRQASYDDIRKASLERYTSNRAYILTPQHPAPFLRPRIRMSNPLDTDAGSELFSSYEAELKLVQADLSQKLDQIPELSGEPRKAAISSAERALEEASELVSLVSDSLQR